VGIVVSDVSRCVPVSEWETGWGISGHSGDVGFGSPCLTFPSAGSDSRAVHTVVVLIFKTGALETGGQSVVARQTRFFNRQTLR